MELTLQIYTRKLTKNNWIKWHCYKTGSHSCKGVETTDKDLADTRSCRPHNHAADETAVAVANASSSMTDMPASSFGRPTTALLDDKK